MKKLLIVLLLCSFLESKAQSNLPIEKEVNIEFFFLPLLYYNSASIGLSIANSKAEHSLSFNSDYFFVPSRFSINAFYNYNLTLKNKNYSNYYLPLWVGVKRINVSNGYEEGSFYDKLNYHLGTGIGAKFTFKNNNDHKFRIELGGGISINSYDPNSLDNESPFPFRLRLDEFTVDKDKPITPALRVNLKYIIPIKKINKN